MPAAMDGESADPRVGVVVLTHNRVDELLRTVGELLNLPEQPRIVVIDNASADGTAAAVVERFPTVQCLTLPYNAGAAGRNVGVQLCERPYVALCDDDTWWEPGSLRCAADLLDAHPELALVTGRVLVGESERLAPACLEMAASPLPVPAGLPGAALLGFHAGASMVRRTAFLEAGGFEPRLFLGAEEELLALDLVSAGWHLAYVAEIAVHHYPSMQRDAEGRRRLLLRNSLWVAWLRRPLRRALVRTLAAARLARRDRAARQALLGAVRGLPWVVHRRCAVPSHVERGLRLLEAGRCQDGLESPK